MKKLIFILIFLSLGSYSFAVDYGDGSDGDKTVSSDWTMDRSYQWTNLTINSGITLNTAGHTIKVNNTLTNNGTITDSISGGAGGAGGVGGAGGTNGSSGGNGVAGSAGVGSGGFGGGGGGGGGGATNRVIISSTHWIANAIGGNGGNGGAGGKAGGSVVILANTFNNADSIHADGLSGSNASNGGNGDWENVSPQNIIADSLSGGGGGGSGGDGGNGGTIKISYCYLVSTGTIRANAGLGGAGGSGGGVGTAPGNKPGYPRYYRMAYPAEGNGGTGSGNAGNGGHGEIDKGSRATVGTSGLAGNPGSAGTVTLNQQTYTNSIKFRTADRTIAIAAETLNESHKLRLKGNEVVYGVPFVPVTASNASPIRIYDGSNIKALPMIGGTKLLLHMDGSDRSTIFTDDGSSGYAIATNGDVQLDTVQKKVGTASGLFDGSGDYLTLAADDGFNFGSEDFMVDFWVKFNTVTHDEYLFSMLLNPYSFRVYTYEENDTPPAYFRFTSNSSLGLDVMLTSLTTISTETWYHIVVARDRNSFKLYVNGTQEASDIDYISMENFSGSTFYIGSSWNKDPLYMLDGWIDEFRIRKGGGDLSLAE